jgi:hypothetical protein
MIPTWFWVGQEILNKQMCSGRLVLSEDGLPVQGFILIRGGFLANDRIALPTISRSFQGAIAYRHDSCW